MVEISLDIKEMISMMLLKNEQIKLVVVSKMDFENFFIFYKVVYFLSLNSGDFSGMVFYIDLGQLVYKQLKSYIILFVGKNVLFVNDQFFVIKIELYDDGIYDIYIKEVYMFIDLYDVSMQFKKE